METWMIEQAVVWALPDGSRTTGLVALAVPMQVDVDKAGCAVHAHGLVTFTGPVYATSKLQALVVALSMLRQVLQDFVDRGGRVLDPDDHARELPLLDELTPLTITSGVTRDM